MDFEIRFYEGLLQKKPDFVQALIALGNLYTKKGLYAQGLEIDKKLAALKPEDPIILYNLACSYSLLKDTDSALKTIKRAVTYGYDNLDHLEQDNDLSNLRNDDRFKKYLARIRNKFNQEKEKSYG